MSATEGAVRRARAAGPDVPSPASVRLLHRAGIGGLLALRHLDKAARTEQVRAG